MAYKALASDCKTTISKFHAAKEVALIRKNNLGCFYRFVNSKIHNIMTATVLKTSSGAAVTDPREKADVFNRFLAASLLATMVCVLKLRAEPEMMVMV